MEDTIDNPRKRTYSQSYDLSAGATASPPHKQHQHSQPVSKLGSTAATATSSTLRRSTSPPALEDPIDASLVLRDIYRRLLEAGTQTRTLNLKLCQIHEDGDKENVEQKVDLDDLLTVTLIAKETSCSMEYHTASLELEELRHFAQFALATMCG